MQKIILNATIKGRIVIYEPEHYNNHSGRVAATLQSLDGTTNFRHVGVVCANGEDPTEKVLAAFGAEVTLDADAPEVGSEQSTVDSGETAAPADAPAPEKAKKTPIKKSVAKK